MSVELEHQRKITVGPKGAPTYIGEFHQSYGDEPQQFHSYCRDHEDFGTCGIEDEARREAENHLIESHGELLLKLALAAEENS